MSEPKAKGKKDGSEILQDVQTSLLPLSGLLTCSSDGGDTSIPLPSSMRREKEAETVMAELKEQVDTAPGVEETVETLTDKNRKLNEEIDTLSETVLDMVDTALEAEETVETLTDKIRKLEEEIVTLRRNEAYLNTLEDLKEEIERCYLEAEHDLKEELEIKNNKVWEMERKLKKTQETNRELETKLQKAQMDLKKQLEENHRQTEHDQSEKLEMENKVWEVMAAADTADKNIAQALENQGVTQKRQRKDEVENETAAKAKRRRSGGDTVACLPEENYLAHKLKMNEMQKQIQRQKAESDKKEHAKKSFWDLLQAFEQVFRQ